MLLRSIHLRAENELGRYSIPRKAKHRPACQAVLRGEVWERETLQFLCDNASGDIIHAGTFFGDMLPALSRHYANVWAFEPNPDSFRCAEETIRLNRLSNVFLRERGLGAEECSASLKTRNKWGRYLGGGSKIVERAGNVSVVSIDHSIPAERHIGMIHLDVEGYEPAVIAGARKTIERCRPILVLETMVAVPGYKLVDRINGNYVLRDR